MSIPVSKDGYVNVTKLCKAGGKEYKHWKENESRGTFVHRRLALIIAQWISADFAVQVEQLGQKNSYYLVQ